MKTTAGLFSALLMGAALISVSPAQAMSAVGMRPSMLEGREVIGMGGHRLGYVLAVNDRARLIELQTPGGVAITMPESRLRLFGGNLFAVNMNRNDVLAMARRQTGRTVAINLDLTHRHFGG